MRDAWIGPCFSVICLLSCAYWLSFLDPTLEIDLKDNVEELSRWLNLNYFAAFLFGHRVTNWANLGLWQLRTGLEESGDFVETRVRVAAVWIREAAPRIYELCAAEAGLDDEALAAGPEFDGKPGFSKYRWEFWLTRLKDASKHDALAKFSKELDFTINFMISIIENHPSTRRKVNREYHA